MANKLDNLKPFKKGQSGNPKGRPVGSKDFKTLFKEALIKLAEKNGKDPADLELEIIEKGLINARSGDYKFYKDLLDRVHGTAVQKVESKEDVTITELSIKDREKLSKLLNE